MANTVDEVGLLGIGQLNSFIAVLCPFSFFIFTRVPDVEINFSSYIQPFDRNLWMAMVAWLLSISAVAVSFKFLTISLLLKKKFRLLTDAGNDLMTTFSALCAQGQ